MVCLSVAYWLWIPYYLKSRQIIYYVKKALFGKKNPTTMVTIGEVYDFLDPQYRKRIRLETEEENLLNYISEYYKKEKNATHTTWSVKNENIIDLKTRLLTCRDKNNKIIVTLEFPFDILDELTDFAYKEDTRKSQFKNKTNENKTNKNENKNENEDESDEDVGDAESYYSLYTNITALQPDITEKTTEQEVINLLIQHYDEANYRYNTPTFNKNKNKLVMTLKEDETKTKDIKLPPKFYSRILSHVEVKLEEIYPIAEEEKLDYEKARTQDVFEIIKKLYTKKGYKDTEITLNHKFNINYLTMKDDKNKSYKLTVPYPIEILLKNFAKEQKK